MDKQESRKVRVYHESSRCLILRRDKLGKCICDTKCACYITSHPDDPRILAHSQKCGYRGQHACRCRNFLIYQWGDCLAKHHNCVCNIDRYKCKAVSHKCICRKPDICLAKKHTCVCAHSDSDGKYINCNSKSHRCICGDICGSINDNKPICISLSHTCICESKPSSCKSLTHICICMDRGSKYCNSHRHPCTCLYNSNECMRLDKHDCICCGLESFSINRLQRMMLLNVANFTDTTISVNCDRNFCRGNHKKRSKQLCNCIRLEHRVVLMHVFNEITTYIPTEISKEIIKHTI